VRKLFYFFIQFLALTNFCYSRETVLFIDTNSNELEIEKARTAARAAGKTFISYPDEGEMFSSERATELLETMSFSTLILSGHDGGGHFSGDNGGIGSGDIRRAMANNPQAREATRHVMLLGCNTSNPGQVLNWQTIFPNLDLVSGYDGTGPSQNTLSGLTYIEQMLTRESEFLEFDNERDLENMLKGIPYIFNLEAGIYVRKRECRDGQLDENAFIFRPLTQTGENRFTELNISECSAILDRFRREELSTYMEYYNGEKDPSSPEGKSEMRRIYNSFHQNAHCFDLINQDTYSDDHGFPSWQTVLSLRFWDETQSNIAEYYEEELNHTFSTLRSAVENPDFFDNVLERKRDKQRRDLEGLTYIKNNLAETRASLVELRDQAANAYIRLESLYGEYDQSYEALFRGIYSQLSERDQELLQSAMSLNSDNLWGVRSEEEVRSVIVSILIDSGMEDSQIATTLDNFSGELSRFASVAVAQNEAESLFQNQYKYERAIEVIDSGELEDNIDWRIDSLNQTLQESTSAGDIQKIASLKKSINEVIPAGFDAEAYGRMSRQEISEFSHKLSGIQSQVVNQLNDFTVARELGIDPLKRFVDEVSFQMNKDYIPFSWHEEHDEIEAPGFGGTHDTWEHEFAGINEEPDDSENDKMSNDPLVLAEIIYGNF
tara:strand:+ start:3415 stop:5403 length:1989 start_codon:yes stop_codon:yes gene_type:complete